MLEIGPIDTALKRQGAVSSYKGSASSSRRSLTWIFFAEFLSLRKRKVQ
jgi:hypothetical protein